MIPVLPWAALIAALVAWARAAAADRRLDDTLAPFKGVDTRGPDDEAERRPFRPGRRKR